MVYGKRHAARVPLCRCFWVNGLLFPAESTRRGKILDASGVQAGRWTRADSTDPSVWRSGDPSCPSKDLCSVQHPTGHHHAQAVQGMQDLLLLQQSLPEDSLGSDGGWPPRGVQASHGAQGAVGEYSAEGEINQARLFKR